MASFTAGTTFSDGVANDVTAAKLGVLVTNATPTSGFIQDRTAETVIASNDTVLIGDASDSNNLKRITVDNLMKAEMTGNINSTSGTIQTLTSSTATITGGTFSGSVNSTTGTIATFNSTTGTIPTLVATTLITTGAGTVTAPAISPTGDSNNGLFFPAADTIAATTNGTERVRVDSSGNVGIGETSPTFTSGGGLHIKNATRAQLRLQDSTTNVFSEIGIADNATTSNFLINVDPTNIGSAGCYFAINTAGTERLRIDSSGNVGIGTASPQNILHISSSGPVIRIQDNDTVGNGTNSIATWFSFRDSAGSQTGYFGFPSDPNFYIWNQTNSAMVFGTNNIERLRITSGGNVGINITNPSEKFVVLESGNTFNCAKFNLSASSGFLYGPWINFSGQAPNNNNSYFLYCNDTANEKCIIYATGTISNRTGTYNSLSDLKAKQDISSSLSQWNDIKALRVVKYRLKDEVAADPNYPYYIGLIAQEVEQISPHLVDQSPDYENVEVVGEDGNTRTERRHTGTFTKSVKTSILYMKAVKALQEAMERIEQLESKVAALEAA